MFLGRRGEFGNTPSGGAAARRVKLTAKTARRGVKSKRGGAVNPAKRSAAAVKTQNGAK
jgi:hypothetical protein